MEEKQFINPCFQNSGQQISTTRRMYIYLHAEKGSRGMCTTEIPVQTEEEAFFPLLFSFLLGSANLDPAPLWVRA